MKAAALGYDARTMAQRVFVALPVSPPLRGVILEWQKKRRDLSVRWIAEKNLHVTVIPPWEEEDVKGAIEALKAIEGTVGEISLAFTDIAYGPTKREPRLIWASGEAPDQLFTLKHSAERILSKNPETRPFRLHLTVARFRPEEFVKFTVKDLHDSVEWNDAVSSFALMESHLSREGADYEVLSEFRL